MQLFTRKSSDLVLKHLLINKRLSETIKNEAKEEKEGLLGMLLGTLGASLLGNLLTGKGRIRQVTEQLEQVKIFNATQFLK